MKPKKMTQRQVENLLCEILPRTYRKQELQLVRRAKDEKSEYKLYEYYRTWGLCEAAEAELIKKAPLWMLEDYVERTKNLCVAAQVALVERRNKKSIMDYIHKDPFPASRAKKALLKWDSPDAREIVMEMLQNEFQQKFFAYYAPLDLLFEAWNILDSDCRAILIQRAARKDSNLVDKIATDKGKQIDKTDEAMFVRYCSDEALKRFIMRPLHSEAQMVLIKKRSASIVQAYLDQRAFTSKEAVDILAKKVLEYRF